MPCRSARLARPSPRLGAIRDRAWRGVSTSQTRLRLDTSYIVRDMLSYMLYGRPGWVGSRLGGCCRLGAACFFLWRLAFAPLGLGPCLALCIYDIYLETSSKRAMADVVSVNHGAAAPSTSFVSGDWVCAPA